MAFPVSLPDDGLIDVMAMPLVSTVFSHVIATNTDAPLVFSKRCYCWYGRCRKRGGLLAAKGEPTILFPHLPLPICVAAPLCQGSCISSETPEEKGTLGCRW